MKILTLLFLFSFGFTGTLQAEVSGTTTHIVAKKQKKSVKKRKKKVPFPNKILKPLPSPGGMHTLSVLGIVFIGLGFFLLLPIGGGGFIYSLGIFGLILPIILGWAGVILGIIVLTRSKERGTPERILATISIIFGLLLAFFVGFVVLLLLTLGA